MLTGSKDIDGGWAWVVLASGVGSLFIMGFLAYSSGIITTALLELFDGDLSFTSAVAATMGGVMNSTGPLAGFMINRFGCRICVILGGVISTIGLAGASLSKDLFTVIWTLGVLTGFGYGLGYTAAIVKIGFNFHTMRPLATGITVAGAGIGMFVGPPVMQILIDHYGLRGSFLIVAGISSHLCVFGSLMRPLPFCDVTENVSIMEKSKKHHFLSVVKHCVAKVKKNTRDSLQIFKNIGFMMYLWSTFCWNVAESAAFVHLPAYCIQQGTSKSDSAFLITIMGIVNICSRMLIGFMANDEGISTLTVLFGLMTVAGVCTGFFPLYSRSYGGQVLYAAVLGIYSSSVNSLMSPFAVQLVGIDDLATAFGLVCLMAGTGYLAGPPTAGAIVDHGATYRESYFFAGAMYIVSGLSAILIPLFHHEKKHHVTGGLDRDFSISLEVVNEKSPCMTSTIDDNVILQAVDTENRTML